jgi:hypothetical protein
MSMRVENSCHFVGINLIHLAFDVLKEEQIFYDWVDRDISLWLDYIIRIDSND